MQHRKESFSSTLENEDVLSRTSLHNKSLWANSSVRNSTPQSAFTKVISPQRILSFNPNAVSSIELHLPVKNLTTFSSSHSMQKKSTSTKTLKDFEVNKSTPCSPTTSKNLVQEFNSQKISTGVDPSKYQPKQPSSNAISFDYDRPTYIDNQTLLSDIPEEESLNHTLTSTTVSNNQIIVSTIGQNAPTSQTVLFTIPQNFNVQQLSNQPLNLDMSSQHLIQSIVQLSNQSDKKTAEKEEGISFNLSFYLRLVFFLNFKYQLICFFQKVFKQKSFQIVF